VSSFKDFYEQYWAGEAPRDHPTMTRLSRKRLELLLSLMPAGTGKILDCGSGDGRLVGQLKALGFHADGLEISDRAVKRARVVAPDATFISHSLEDRPWPVTAAGYDVATCWEVVEHVLEPRTVLLGIHDSLRPEGYLAITTPYHGLWKNLVLALYGFDRHYAVEGPHIRFFTDRALSTLLNACGFNVERLIHFGRAPSLWMDTFAWAQRH
jgi:2-polyprenyl-3-methyl-5-hydroxy-6-metoxy-1,4-benzoquinol methylase